VKEIVLTDDAKNDLQDVAVWYENQQKGLGFDFLDEFENSINIIENNPKLYPVIYKKVRRALMNRFPYAILYLIQTSGTVVFAVFHTSRNPKTWKSRIQ